MTSNVGTARELKVQLGVRTISPPEMLMGEGLCYVLYLSDNPHNSQVRLEEVKPLVGKLYSN